MNGVVSLAKSQPELIEPREVAVVEQAVHRHPKAHNYRVNVKRNMIEVYERVGPDADDMTRVFENLGLGERMRGWIENEAEHHSHLAPVLRFVLVDTRERTFAVERKGYSSSLPDWMDVCASGKIEPLGREWIPRLGTDALFDSFGIV